MRPAICLILALMFAGRAGGQSRADTLAVFEAAAKKIGYDTGVEPATEWRVTAVEVKLSFPNPSKVVFQLYSYCTMKRQGDTWAFMQGDIVSLEKKEDEWVAMEHASVIS